MTTPTPGSGYSPPPPPTTGQGFPAPEAPPSDEAPATTTVIPTKKTPRTPTLRVPRRRGVVSGVLVVLLGVWGGLIPLVGPSFDFGYTPDDAWDVTDGRWAMSIAPAAAAVLGGLLLVLATNRPTGLVGGGLACLGGAWFVVGPIVAPLWDDDGDFVGSPLGTTKSGDNTNQIVAEQLSVFFGVGLLIVFLAAVAAARFTVFGVGDVEAAEQAGIRRQVAKEQRLAEKEALRAHKQARKDSEKAHKQAEKDAEKARREAEQHPQEQPGQHPPQPAQPPQYGDLNTPSSGQPLPPHPVGEQPTQFTQQPPPGWQPPGGTPPR